MELYNTLHTTLIADHLPAGSALLTFDGTEKQEVQNRLADFSYFTVEILTLRIYTGSVSRAHPYLQFEGVTLKKKPADL